MDALFSGYSGVKIEVRCRLLRILGDVHKNRAWSAGTSDKECLAQRGRDLFGAGDEVVVLRDRQRDSGDVHLLKGVGTKKLARDLAGDADDRDRVEHRSRQSSDKVGRAWA